MDTGFIVFISSGQRCSKILNQMQSEIAEGMCSVGINCRSTCMVGKNMKWCLLFVEGEKRYIGTSTV